MVTYHVLSGFFVFLFSCISGNEGKLSFGAVGGVGAVWKTVEGVLGG